MSAVYTAIAAVMADLSKEGIAKDSKNEGQKFMFRGIDAAYNALSPLLAKHGLLMLPRLISHRNEVRDTQGGRTVNWVFVEMEFDLVATDGSKHTIKTVGEAMDSGDKASNKAMSAAFKYAAFQAFCIPTEGDNDADSTNHQLAPSKNVKRVEDGEPWLKSIGLTDEQIGWFKDDCAHASMDWEEVAKNARGAQVRGGADLTRYVDDIQKRPAQSTVPATPQRRPKAAADFDPFAD